MRLKRSLLALGILFTVGMLQASARADLAGVSPYATLNLEPEIERDLERTLILADRPIISRPIALGRVVEALPRACRRDTRLCRRVRAYIKRVDQNLLADASASYATSSGSSRPVANGHGMSTDSAWSVAFDGGWQPNAFFRAGFGAVLNATRRTATGSFLSTGISRAQLDIGYRDHWLSPLTDSTMLIGTEAATMPSVTLSNWQPLTRAGIQYQVFLADMSPSSNIALGSGFTTGSPRLAGLQLAVAPADGWSMSVNRLLQFGGGGRGGTSLKSFLRALFNPRGADNAYGTLTTTLEQGNQVASLASRMLFQGRTPFAISFEYAGEDTSHANNLLLGNSALSAGIDFPQLWKDFDFSFEVTDWQNGWYVHHIYQDGLSNYGNVIGNWFGDQRVRNDGVGGQSHMARLRWQLDDGGVAQMQYRTLANASYTGFNYRPARELTLDYSRPWHGWRVGGELLAGLDVYGKNYARFSGSIRMEDQAAWSPLENTDTHDSDAEAETIPGVERFVDLGIGKWHEHFESSDRVPQISLRLRSSKHFGIGARRAVSAHQDLGARVEKESVDGVPLLAVRALDYRYRWGRHLAFTGYAGAARLALATPAYGYLFGGGAQWRNLFHHIDLNVELRYGAKLARDSLLPTDPPPVSRPDMFYTLSGAAVYLSIPF
jgi:hypothetical protein